MSDWSKINDFCKVKALPASQNSSEELPVRVKFITEWLDSMNMAYEVDKFEEEEKSYGGGFLSWFSNDNKDEDEDVDGNIDDMSDDDFWNFLSSDDSEWADWDESMLDGDDNKDKNSDEITERKRIEPFNKFRGHNSTKKREPKITIKYYYNIMLKGSSDKMLCAHHDIVNPNSDNANDNSCSVINAILSKKLKPELNVVIVDGEEIGGKGSKRAAQQVKDGEWGTIKWVLNLELTGAGGENFFIGTVRHKSELGEAITKLFKCPSVSAPFNDSYSFIEQGIDSININPLPITDKKTSAMHNGNYLQMDMLWNCHSMRDSLETISPKDMEIFTKKVICEIVDKC